MGAIKNILVTGATGYLGSHLVKCFVDNGYNVIILKRITSSVLKILPLLDKVQIVNVENIDYDDLFRERRIDAIVHTATSYGRKGENFIEIFNTNLIFPLQLLEYALKYQIEYFFNTNTSLPANLNLYSLSKKQFSDILKLKSNSIKVIDIELEYFYGPGDDISKFTTFIISKLKMEAPLINLSPGTQIRDFIYIDDVTSAYLLLMENAYKFPNFKSVPLGTGQGITLRNLTETIKSYFKGSKTQLNFGALPLREGEIMNSVANISFLSELGWKPNFDLNKGLEQTINIKN
jgi:nucleoside-diphosphate-sugar epimerase